MEQDITAPPIWRSPLRRICAPYNNDSWWAVNERESPALLHIFMHTVECALVHIPHADREYRRAPRAVAVESADVIIFKPVQHWSKIDADTVLVVSQCFQRVIDRVDGDEGDRQTDRLLGMRPRYGECTAGGSL